MDNESSENIKNVKGLQILVSIGTLLESACDKDASVRDAISSSLCKLSQRYPNEVVKTICSYRQRNQKLGNLHIGLIMSILKNVCTERTMMLDGDSVLQAIELSALEMTRCQDPTLEVNQYSSGVLVALGQLHCIQVMDSLLSHLQNSAIPHYMIPYTMGSLSSINPFGTVPFVKQVLSLSLPILGMIKNDNLKQAFSFAFGRFCEAITEYLSNISKAPDPTVTKELFTTELSIAFDILLAQWLPSRDSKVSQDVLGALGPIFNLLTAEKVAEHIPKLIPLLLSLYRRNIDKLSITQCLVTVLNVATATDKNVLEPLIDPIFNTMFEQISTTPDFELPAKNHFETLRCFDLLINNSSSDRLFDLVLNQLKNNNEKDRIRACLVIAHLTNSSENYVKTKICDLNQLLKVMIQTELNPKMKIVLLKTIVAFANRGFLEDNDFVEFIVKYSCQQKYIPKQNETGFAKEYDDLLRACNSSLFLISTNVTNLESMLWSVLLQCLLNTKYTDAVPTLTRCLAHLALKIQEKTDLNKSKAPTNVPTELSIFSRCLAMLGNPLEQKKGVYILNFLKNYCSFINKQLVPLWSQKIQSLLWFLENGDEEFNQKIWEEYILDFLSSTIKDIDDVNFTESLSNKMMEQISMYNNNIDEKGVLYKCIAATLCNISDAQCVTQKIGILLSFSKHNSVAEAKHCAEAIGICSRVHYDVVLTKLKTIEKDELGKKSSKFLSNFNFMKDAKHESEIEKIRFTLISCFGCIALEAPSEKILPKIECDIVDWIVHQLTISKEYLITAAALNTIGYIADAMNPDRNTLNIKLSRRSEILNTVLNQLLEHTIKENLELYPIVLKVATSLIKLKPEITSDERITILSLIFDKTYNAACDIKTKFNTFEEELANDHFAKHLNLALNNLNKLVQEILLQDVSPATLDDIFALLESYMKNKNSEIRLAAMVTLQGMIKAYFDNMKFVFEAPTKFNQAGFIIGRIAPRCTDSNGAIRQIAAECISITLAICSRYEGHSDSTMQETIELFMSIRSEIETSDPKRLYQITVDLGNVISQKLPHFQLLHFIESVVDGLLDPENSSAIGSSVLLCVFIKNKGGELYHSVSTIVAICIQVAGMSHCSKAKIGGIKAVTALAVHHPKAVVFSILQQPLPYEGAVTECFYQWTQESNLVAETIDMFIKMLSSTPLHEDNSSSSQPNSNRALVATLQPLGAVHAMSHMFLCAQMQELCVKRFPELFSLMISLISGYCGLAPPIHTQADAEKYGYVPNRNVGKIVPAKMASECFKNFLLCVELDQIAETLLKYNGDSLSSFLQTIPMLTHSLVAHAPQHLSRIVETMVQYSHSSFVTQRLAAMAFFAELVPLSSNHVLIDSLLTTLHGGTSDPAPIIRQSVLIGLSRVGIHEPRRSISRYAPAALGAVIQGLDDEEKGNSLTNIPLESMKGISNLLKVASESQILEIQVTVAVRIRPHFESTDTNVRVAAIRLFGDLALPSFSDKCEGFKEQVFANLACFLLHLCEPDATVVKACKYTLRHIAPVLGAVKVNSMLQDHLIDEGSLHYDAFIADLTKTLMDELPNSVNGLAESAMPFLKSSYPEIRGNAALFLGLLHGLAIFPMPLDVVCFRLSKLLEDENVSVRAKAAIGLGALFGS